MALKLFQLDRALRFGKAGGRASSRSAAGGGGGAAASAANPSSRRHLLSDAAAADALPPLGVGSYGGFATRRVAQVEQ